MFNEELARALDELVDELLNEAQIDMPPVWADEIAESINARIIVDAHSRGQGSSKNGLHGKGGVIVMPPQQRVTRFNFKVGHEVGELLSAYLCERTILEPDDLTSDVKEKLCDAFSGRLLCPSRWFWDDCRQLKWDLFELREIYYSASREAIARRWLDVEGEAKPTSSRLLTTMKSGSVKETMERTLPPD
ncbi:MAG: ImmA/IrrE family metallo-endopeptidase [Planctomycetota bacterium]|nr:ImmA/IrrE family metallo-endopeptidase [Planctomycetota bacterium]